MVMLSLICVLLAVFKLFWGFGIDLSLKTEEEEVGKFGSKIPALSEYASALESHVKLRYLKKISTVGSTLSSFLDTVVYKGDRFHKESILDVRTYFKPTIPFNTRISIRVTHQASLKASLKERL